MLIAEGSCIEQFQLINLVGRGGMGEVYRARDTRLNRIVALKVLSKAVLTKKTVLARFHKEMQVLARMNHPNVVKIFTFGQVDDVHYFVQEFVEGQDLQVRLDRDGPLPAREVFRIARTVADAFCHFHPLGVVHRDLKPANLMVDAEGTLKIMDFGLVRDEEASRLTETGGLVGTLAYLPPEVMEGGDPSALTDIYQLGCILYELLLGEMVLDRRDYLTVGFARLREKLTLLERLPSNLDPGLEAVIRSCLAPDPERRPQTGEQIIALLEGEELHQEAPHAAPPTRRTGARLAPSATVPAAPRPFTGLRRAPLVAVAMLLVALVLIVFTHRSAPPARVFADLRCRVEPGRVNLAWRGSRPHGVRWSVADPDGVTRSGSSSADAPSHELTVPGLRPGTTYRLVLESSLGERFEREVTTPAVALEGPAVVTRGRTAAGLELVVRFRTTAPVAAALECDGPARLSVEGPKVTSHRLSLTLPAAATGALAALLRLDGAPAARLRLPLGPAVLFSVFRGDHLLREQVAHVRENFRGIADDTHPFRILSGPVVAGSTCYLGDRNGFVYAVTLGEGEAQARLAWALRLPDGVRNIRPRPWALLPRPDGHLLVVADDGLSVTTWYLDGAARARAWPRLRDSAGGEEMAAASSGWAEPRESWGEWRSPLGAAFPNLSPAMPVTALPGERLLFWRPERGLLECVDPFRSRVAWSCPVPGVRPEVSRPLVTSKGLYLTVRSALTPPVDSLVAVDPATGRMQFRLPLGTGGGPFPASPGWDGASLVAGSTEGIVRVVPSRDGDVPAGRAPGEWTATPSGTPVGTPVLTPTRLAYLSSTVSRTVRLMAGEGVSHMRISVRVHPVAERAHDEPLPSAPIVDNEPEAEMTGDAMRGVVVGDRFVVGYGNAIHVVDLGTGALESTDVVNGRLVDAGLPLGNDVLFATLGGDLARLSLPSTVTTTQ